MPRAIRFSRTSGVQPIACRMLSSGSRLLGLIGAEGPSALPERLRPRGGGIKGPRMLTLPRARPTVHPTLTSDASALPGGPHRLRLKGPPPPPRRQWWRMWLVGRPLHSADAAHQAVGKAVGLAIFASDALSSTAYATQEILVVLAAAGLGALHYVFPVSVAIVVLLAIVTLSYEQTIHAYPSGGGAYIVARDNLGELP